MYLVTGGAGFIGSHTTKEIFEDGNKVRVFDDLSAGDPSNLSGMEVELFRGDVCDPAAIREAIHGCSAVIHLAAKVSVLGFGGGSDAFRQGEQPRLSHGARGRPLGGDLPCRVRLELCSIRLFPRSSET